MRCGLICAQPWPYPHPRAGPQRRFGLLVGIRLVGSWIVLSVRRDAARLRFGLMVSTWAGSVSGVSER